MEFAGRRRDLATLGQQWELVQRGGHHAGVALIVTGRRRVGKSHLIQEFVDRLDAPNVVFQATKGRDPAAERADFVDAIAQSSLPRRDLVAGLVPSDWNQALRLLVTAVGDTPSVLVIDEVPWILAWDAEFEGALQTVWDRQLSALPVLLLLVGSDTSTMESLQNYDRAFYGRTAKMVVEPLPVSDVADVTGLPSAEAIDAWLVTGGFPDIVASWRPRQTVEAFLGDSLTNPLSPLLVSGELTLLGEFPAPSLARSVLEALGAGERTFSGIANVAGRNGPVPSGSLAPVLRNLEAKRVVLAQTPLSARPDTRNRRYRVIDSYLSFWLAFGPVSLALAQRGRPDVALTRLLDGWQRWRGRAVEAVVRASLERLLPDAAWPTVTAVGGWWNRANSPEIDLVGADQSPVADQVGFVGSIKWRDAKPFDRHDYDALVRSAVAAGVFPPAVELVAVSRSTVTPSLPLAATWHPDDLVDAWR